MNRQLLGIPVANRPIPGVLTQPLGVQWLESILRRTKMNGLTFGRGLDARGQGALVLAPLGKRITQWTARQRSRGARL